MVDFCQSETGWLLFAVVVTYKRIAVRVAGKLLLFVIDYEEIARLPVGLHVTSAGFLHSKYPVWQ
jgi:hypothetical protein